MATSALSPDTKLAVEKATTWNTPATLGAGSQLAILGGSLDGVPDILEDETIVDTAENAPPDVGPFRVSGDLRGISDFNQDQRVMLRALIVGGTGGAGTLVETGVYTHVLRWAASTLGLFATFGKELALGTNKALLIDAIKPRTLVITGEAGGRVIETMTFLGAGVSRAANPSTWAYTANPKAGASRHQLTQHGVLRINAQSGGALGAPDSVKPRDFTLTLDRNLGEDVTDGADPDEPSPDGPASIVFDVGFHKATEALVDLLRDALDNGTALKADYVFTSTVLAGATEYFKTSYYFPYLRVVEAPLDLPGAGRVPFRVKFSAHHAGATAPTGFTAGYVEAFIEFLQNGLSADPLA